MALKLRWRRGSCRTSKGANLPIGAGDRRRFDRDCLHRLRVHRAALWHYRNDAQLKMAGEGRGDRRGRSRQPMMVLGLAIAGLCACLVAALDELVSKRRADERLSKSKEVERAWREGEITSRLSMPPPPPLSRPAMAVNPTVIGPVHTVPRGQGRHISPAVRWLRCRPDRRIFNLQTRSRPTRRRRGTGPARHRLAGRCCRFRMGRSRPHRRRSVAPCREYCWRRAGGCSGRQLAR